MDLFQLYVTLFFFTLGIWGVFFLAINGIFADTWPYIYIYVYVNACMYTYLPEFFHQIKMKQIKRRRLMIYWSFFSISYLGCVAEKLYIYINRLENINKQACKLGKTYRVHLNISKLIMRSFTTNLWGSWYL